MTRLTNNRNPPSARQKTKGPAISVSCNIDWSACLNGFNTQSVCEYRKKTLMLIVEKCSKFKSIYWQNSISTNDECSSMIWLYS